MLDPHGNIYPPNSDSLEVEWISEWSDIERKRRAESVERGRAIEAEQDAA